MAVCQPVFLGGLTGREILTDEKNWVGREEVHLMKSGDRILVLDPPVKGFREVSELQLPVL